MMWNSPFCHFGIVTASLLALSTTMTQASHSLSLASRGKARVTIITDPAATPAEQSAAQELADYLRRITGATFELKSATATNPSNAIILGPGSAAAKCFPEVDLTSFGAEEYVIRSKGTRLLLAGGRPRGTLYAVNRFLQDQCGVRWWTPWATNVPHRTSLRIADLDLHSQPAFEYREPYWFQSFDPLWRSYLGINGQGRPIPPERGGYISYKGFAHTFYQLVPPEKYFATHPEWFSLIKGRRIHDRAQLCTSNPELRDFMVQRVKEWLRESPEASIISVTQNDWYNTCQCDHCKAIDDAEGSPSGSMLALVNYIAGKIEPEFPHVAVDTFAYQYTRKPPQTIKPRPNVIVRLCSIECNFREPFDHPSNASFLADLEGWSKICQRLYIWDYTTDFKNYINPHPNWFVLGPNLRILQQHGVRGVFEQGSYQGFGGEMGELRSWVLAQLLWNPKQDDRALIKEFLEGYYGRAAARPIAKYLELMTHESEGFYLSCFLRKGPPHLRFAVLNQAELLWQQAEKAAASDPGLLARVRLSHLPVRHAFLAHWGGLRRECWEQEVAWPLSPSRKIVADEFRATCAGGPGQDWTTVRLLNESGLSVEQFLKPFDTDPPEERLQRPPKRKERSAPTPPK